LKEDFVRNVKSVITAIVGIVVVFFGGCGRDMSSNPEQKKQGMLAINVLFESGNLKKLLETTQTSFDSLVVEISGSDFQMIRKSMPLSSVSPVQNDTIMNIPEGENRLVRVFTKDKSNQVIHQDSLITQTVRVVADNVTVMFVKLKPGFGSFYLQIANVPDTVDSVVAVFSTGVKTWISSVKRSSKVLLSLDNIPNNTSGTISVYGINIQKDTLYRASAQLTYLLSNTTTVHLSFHTQPGALGLNVTITPAPSTIVTANMGAFTYDTEESGEIFITEIMYAANDSEYIELYNPSTIAASYDTLYIDIDGEMRVLTNIIITPSGYFTIGRRLLPWVNTAMSTVSFLDLTQNGNWITIRNRAKQMIDRVVYTGVSNAQEWPQVSGKRSLRLQPDRYGAQMNNHGKHWGVSQELISGSTSQYGSPGSL
jgi:hypothetical protein